MAARPAHPARSLPPGWRWAKLGEVCEFIRGVGFDKADMQTTPSRGFLPILRAGNIGARLNVTDDLVYVPERHVAQEQRLRLGDIAICMSSGSADVVGKTARLSEEWRGSVGAFCGIIRPRDREMADWVGFWFRSREFRDWRDSQARGANIQNLRFSQFEGLQMPWPPLPEQRRIAGILKEQMAEVEKARKATEAQLEAARAMPAAYLREEFPKPDSPLPSRWRWAKLGEVCEIATGGTPSTGVPEYYSNEVPWMKSGDVTGGYITQPTHFISRLGLANSNARLHPKGTVLLAMSGQGKTRGTAAVLGIDAACSQSVAAILPGGHVLPDIIFYWLTLRYDETRRMTGDNERSGLNLQLVGSIPMPVPPLPDQRRIAGILKEQMAEVEKLRTELEAKLAEFDKLPAALLRKAFAGEV